MPIYRGSKNENLHSGVWVRRLGVCQSTGEARMRIFDLLGIKNSDKFMLRVKKALETSLGNQE